MELAVATAIGVLVSAGVYLLLRARSFDVILGLTLRRLGTTLVSRTASGAMIFATGLLTWNWFFTPFYGGLRIAILLLALSFVLRPPPPAPPAARRWS